MPLKVNLHFLKILFLKILLKNLENFFRGKGNNSIFVRIFTSESIHLYFNINVWFAASQWSWHVVAPPQSSSTREYLSQVQMNSSLSRWDWNRTDQWQCPDTLISTGSYDEKYFSKCWIMSFRRKLIEEFTPAPRNNGHAKAMLDRKHWMKKTYIFV